MPSSRRNFLQLGGLGAVAALSGCTFFGDSQEHAAVVVENDHDTAHLLSVAVSTPPDDGGYTEYFSETLQIQASESETFDQGLAFTDYPPSLFAMAMIDGETTQTTEFELSRDVQELRVRITESGQIEMTTAADN